MNVSDAQCAGFVAVKTKLRFACMCLKSRCLVGQSTMAIPLEERFTAILLSYKRPWNMDLLVRIALAVPFVDRVILSNNNPSVHIRKFVSVRDSRLILIDQAHHSATPIRWRIAFESGAQKFLLIDDDIFIPPRALSALCHAFLQNPSIPHGIFGEIMDPKTKMLRHGIAGYDGTMDIINRVYVCSREHVLHLLELARCHGVSFTESHWDDLFLSFCGECKPMAHNLPYLDCPTQGDPAIAVWKQPGFFQKRMLLFQDLQRSGFRAGRTLAPA